MLKVHDLDRSIDFYSTLFASAPTKRREGYAQWLLDDPRVNFSLSDRGDDARGIEHLGIQAKSPEEFDELRRRVDALAEAALVDGSVDEDGTTCCYYRSDKSWITDAQGVSWELFHSFGEASSYAGAADGRNACCEDARCDEARCDEARCDDARAA